MDNVINLSDKKREKIIRESGLDPKNLLLCFDGDQFIEILKKFFSNPKPASEILLENKDLYRIGYLDTRVDKVDLIDYE